MTLNGDANTYEEARKLRLEENKKRFEDLGIAKISKSLTVLTNSQKKASVYNFLPKQHFPRPRGVLVVEPRRSTRSRNPIKSYADEMDIDTSFQRKRSRPDSSSWASYLARPIEEVKFASCEQRTAAFQAAEELQRSLKTENPCFVKSMLRSHVYSCFWLGLPTKFCEDHLPKSSVDIELEDEDGKIHDAIYIGKRTGLSGGWRGFALEHKLDDGDALVFELVEPTKFKIYFVRASTIEAKDHLATAKKKPKTTMKLGFKQKKKVPAGKTKGSTQLDGEEDVAKYEGESEVANEVNSCGYVENGTTSIRRSKRKLATKSS